MYEMSSVFHHHFLILEGDDISSHCHSNEFPHLINFCLFSCHHCFYSEPFSFRFLLYIFMSIKLHVQGIIDDFEIARAGQPPLPLPGRCGLHLLMPFASPAKAKRLYKVSKVIGYGNFDFVEADRVGHTLPYALALWACRAHHGALISIHYTSNSAQTLISRSN